MSDGHATCSQSLSDGQAATQQAANSVSLCSTIVTQPAALTTIMLQLATAQWLGMANFASPILLRRRCDGADPDVARFRCAQACCPRPRRRPATAQVIAREP